MGALLGMGPEGDLGGHHLICLLGLYPLPPDAQVGHQDGPLDAAHRFHPLANVLVGHQLFAFCSSHQCAYLHQLSARNYV